MPLLLCFLFDFKRTERIFLFQVADNFTYISRFCALLHFLVVALALVGSPSSLHCLRQVHEHFSGPSKIFAIEIIDVRLQELNVESVLLLTPPRRPAGWSISEARRKWLIQLPWLFVFYFFYRSYPRNWYEDGVLLRLVL